MIRDNLSFLYSTPQPQKKKYDTCMITERKACIKIKYIIGMNFEVFKFFSEQICRVVLDDGI